MLHVLELPLCRLVHTHALGQTGVCSFGGIASDPGGEAIIALGRFTVSRGSRAGEVGGAFDIRVLRWPLAGLTLLEPLQSLEILLEAHPSLVGGMSGGVLASGEAPSGGRMTSSSLRLSGIRPPTHDPGRARASSCNLCEIQ